MRSARHNRYVTRTLEPDGAAEPLGPYSLGMTDGKLVFTAGQIPVTPDGEVLADEPIGVQTEQALSNIEQILAEADLGLDNVLKVTVYLTDIEDFDRMNEVYREFFDTQLPARTAIEVGALADGAAIEIEAVASS